MTAALHGLGVSRGTAIGRVHVIEQDRADIPEYRIEAEQVEAESQRLTAAIAQAKQELRAIRKQIPSALSVDIAAFIDTHLLMLEDAALTHEPLKLIRESRRNAEWALKLQRDALVSAFEEMDDSYLRTRQDDISHVVDRIQRILLKQQSPQHEEVASDLGGRIVIAADLPPADTVVLQRQGIVAFATEYGGEIGRAHV